LWEQSHQGNFIDGEIMDLIQDISPEEGIWVSQQDGAADKGKCLLASIKESGSEFDHIDVTLEDIGFPCLYRNLNGTVDILETASFPRGATADHFAEGVSVSVDRTDAVFPVHREQPDL
jgi:hypothetical protein